MRSQAQAALRHRTAELETLGDCDRPGRAAARDVDLDIDALEPTFRAQEMSLAADAVGANIDRALQAENRGFGRRLLGCQPDGIGSPLAAARERAASHLEPHSVWLHNSVRGAIALAVAVLIADLSGVQHAFWVVLGTLSVLRSNALSTGQHAVRGLLGTTAGVVLGGAIVLVIGRNTAALWIVLPGCVLVAGLAPAMISFAAGQAGFTLTIVILFDLL